jgi:hypothetical protein
METTDVEDGNDASPRGEDLRVRAFLCADADLARDFERRLSKAEIPARAMAREDGRGIIAIPESFADRATRFLLSTTGVVFETGADPHFRRHDPARDETIIEHPVLSMSPAEIASRAGAVDDLEQCVRRGSAAVIDRAILLLGRAGPAANPAIDRLLRLSVESGNAPLLGALFRVAEAAKGRAGALPPSLADLPALMRHGDATVRQLAVRAIVAFAPPDAIPQIADCLLDESPEVAIEADDAFLEWGAEDLGFDPEIDDDAKKKIAAARRGFRPKHQR